LCEDKGKKFISESSKCGKKEKKLDQQTRTDRNIKKAMATLERDDIALFL